MKQKIIYLILFFISFNLSAQEKEVKNVILMIPDGTSLSVISLSRWYKAINENSLNDSLLKKSINELTTPKLLCFENLLCGLVMTHSANGLISESAPAATEMAIAKKSDPGFLGISTDSIPHITNMELARIKKNKSTGLVFTCEFPHATPAAFTSHCLERNDYNTIKKQMIYNQLNVVFGGGYGGHNVLMPEDKEKLEGLGYSVFNNFKELDSFNGNKTWGLFNKDTSSNGYMAFDIDRKTLDIDEPSLAEMTNKAIEILEKNENGFFLMVEGSKVDWAAHNNDPVGIITEFLAFEKAVNVALDYANKNKNTAVIICTDHGNGGFSIGNNYSDKKTNFNNNPKYIQYNHLPYKTIVDNLNTIPLTSDGFNKLFTNATTFNKQKIKDDYLKNYCALINNSKTNITPITLNDSIKLYIKKGSKQLASHLKLNQNISDNTYIGWTSKGHTGEDVPLYIYHPNQYVLHGTLDNTTIGAYINEVLGLDSINNEVNSTYFNAYNLNLCKNYTLKSDTLTILKNNDTHAFIINSNIYYKNEEKQNLTNLNILINNTLYSSKNILDCIK